MNGNKVNCNWKGNKAKGQHCKEVNDADSTRYDSPRKGQLKQGLNRLLLII